MKYAKITKKLVMDYVRKGANGFVLNNDAPNLETNLRWALRAAVRQAETTPDKPKTDLAKEVAGWYGIEENGYVSKYSDKHTPRTAGAYEYDGKKWYSKL